VSIVDVYASEGRGMRARNHYAVPVPDLNQLETDAREAVARMRRAEAELDAAREAVPAKVRAYWVAAIDTVPTVQQAARIKLGESTLRAMVTDLAAQRRAAKRAARGH
jgi:hypothetical protein